MNLSLPRVSPAQLNERMRTGQSITLLDVRSPAEYRAGHVKGALSVPLDELDSTDLVNRTGVAGIGQETPLYLTCQAGLRAQQAAERLNEGGHHNLVLLEGGTEAWARAGLPMRGSANALTLEQQVQITIGALLILKVAFGFAVHELFFVLGALIGAGLITAGITRWCGMARLLARMPWNRGHRDTDHAVT
jgi:rhodanese-related sulfurtransferase